MPSFRSLSEVKKALGKLSAHIRDISESESIAYLRLNYIPDKEVWRQVHNEITSILGKECAYKNGMYSVKLTKVTEGPLDKAQTAAQESIGVRALIPEAGEAKGPVEGFQMVPIAKLLSPVKPLRLGVDDEYIAGLTETVKAQGIIQPIIVRPKDDGWYEVVAGEQRLQAARKAGLKEIPAIVRNLNDLQSFKAKLTENLQRKNLTDYEVAKALKDALSDFPDEYSTQSTLAFSLGKSENWISNHLAILEFEGKITARTLQEVTHTQARELREAPDEKREEILKQVAETGKVPSSREIEAQAKPSPAPAVTAPATGKQPGGKAVGIDIDVVGKLCPICGRVISKSLYEQLKTKFIDFVGLFK